jgi:cellulose synthase/poly-beta-1,6-N-acetylglucosamine synthase-like glycosyltransferase
MIIIYILFAYLLINVSYYAFYTLAGHLFKKVKSQKTGASPKKIAVFVPAYKEDGIIVDTAKRALLQRYPRNQYDVYVIADSLQMETMESLSLLPIKVIEVSFEQSTKAKAINETYKRIKTHYDIVVVLDADNVMEKDFLLKINQAYSEGKMAIQGHRVAKNSENEMAVMDGVSEEVNNHIFRKGHQNAGLSSALIGSGMAFDFNLFKSYMSDINAIGGFDKALELAFLKDGVKIHYLEDALVYDEKVANDQTFTRQRTRWIAAQIRYGIGSFGDAFVRLLTKGNVDYFDKSLQFLLLPRLILLGVLVISVGVGLLVAGWTGAIWTISAMVVYAVTLLMAMPAAHRKATVFKAATRLPRTFILMIIAILGFKKAKNNFLHTPHHTNAS